MNQIILFLNNKELLIFEFFFVWYLQLSSTALCWWIQGVFKKERDHVIDKIFERVVRAPLPKLIRLPGLIVESMGVVS